MKVQGGTNWGQISYPSMYPRYCLVGEAYLCLVAYTSYDYGAAITESRELTAKFDELKLQSLFLRSVRDLYKTDLISKSCF